LEKLVISEPEEKDYEAVFGDQVMSVFEAMADGVWVCDTTPKLLWINSACEELNNINRQDVCGKSVAELLDIGNFDTDVTHQVLSSGKPVAIIQKVKSGRTLLVNGVPVYDSDGNISLVVGSERDLTELNVLRSDIEEKQQLQSRMQSELLALKLRDLKNKEIVAISEAMEQLMESVFRVAGFDTTILLNGASGSGKSMIARVLHEGSIRRDRTFLSLNCGAIPASLIEAELFGYTGGSFTGALTSGKVGLIEAANGGTLFLDEIDAFPLEAQVKLLTFLDTQSFISVGDTKVKEVDVRLIVATNKDLNKLVQSGAFRDDLLFRLNVVPLRLPSLKERQDDLPTLIQKILTNLAEKHGIRKKLDAEALALLSRYSFPGNVRELENILERIFVMSSEGETIFAASLPHDVKSKLLPLRHQNEETIGLEAAIAETEYIYLKRACKKYSRQIDIAHELNLSQPTIARLLKKHGLAPVK
jgi:PAS domain S-box-containing protein